MKWFKKGFLLLLVIVAVIAAGIVVVINPFGPSPVNRYIRQGELNVAGLKQPVRVLRDEKGMPYIYAADLDDLVFAQGFVMAQDRLFQMELIKLMATGRIGELAGEQARALDLRMRTLGFHRYAKRHIELLSADTQYFFQRFADGVNAMAAARPQDVHLEFRLASIRPSQWTPEESLAILYFMGWNSAGNLHSEIVSQMLVEKLGYERASRLFPINLHPDEYAVVETVDPAPASSFALLGDRHLQRLSALAAGVPALGLGSNNWAVGANRSVSGQPILAADPHLEAEMLPGPWYPCGLIAPGIRAVGVTIPGTPGIAAGRTDHVAFGMTNAYGDTQDLYVETVDSADPERYMEGAQSIPFDVFEEIFRFKNKDAPDGFTTETVRIRATRRGPVVSEVLPVGAGIGQVVSVRWSAFEAMGSALGFERFLFSRNSAEFREALGDVAQICLNFVFADRHGDIGWHVTGRLPIRSRGNGRMPHVVQDGEDDWRGWIPFDRMPHDGNPESGWLGTSNHKTITSGYPYYYSDFFSTPFRQLRMMALMQDEAPASAQAHWLYQRDVVNLKAADVAPVMAMALLKHPETEHWGRILESWDHRDSADQVAPALFHAIFHEFARSLAVDELGETAARRMLSNTYYWEQRLIAMIADGRSTWFEDEATSATIESQQRRWQQAALTATGALEAAWGRDPSAWRWGDIHRYDFFSPIARRGLARRLLGGGSHPAEGSGDTLLRAKVAYDDLSGVPLMASLRMVADLGDPDKVLAVLPGGVTGRQFHPHMTDQIEAFINGDEVYWWFSDEAIRDNARYHLLLKPLP